MVAGFITNGEMTGGRAICDCGPCMSFIDHVVVSRPPLRGSNERSIARMDDLVVSRVISATFQLFTFSPFGYGSNKSREYEATSKGD